MSQTLDQATESVNQIFDLYTRFGNDDYIGEPVSQIEHMSQAAQLAIDEGFDDEVVLAAFFHDIGHLCAAIPENSMGGYGVKSHGDIGAEYLLKKGFSKRVAQLVQNHVQAKRYLTYRQPSYYDSLSEASKKTLVYQGGKMTEEEAVRFEMDPLFEASIRMRKWDELAKEEHVSLISLEELRKRALDVLMNA